MNTLGKSSTRVLKKGVAQKWSFKLSTQAEGKNMIKITDLKDSDVGRLVIYRSKGGDKKERGKISTWNDMFIFVNYENYPEICPDFFNPTAAATSPEDLTFVSMIGRTDELL